MVALAHSSPARGLRTRAAVELLIAAVVLGVLVRTWCLEPRTVTGGSMAETLLGVHRQVVCADCGAKFPCGSDEAVAAGARAVCPACGSAGNRLDTQPDRPGDRLLVDRSAFQFRRPRRWEVVALRVPDQAADIAIKRVVGLPGEAVQLRRGDVYVNGEIQRKTLQEQRAMAVLVDGHPAARGTARTPAFRWTPAPGSGWMATAAGFACRPAGGELAWLSYRHERQSSCEGPGVRTAAVTDDYGYNQTRPRLDGLHPVPDLLLSCRLRAAGEGELVFHARCEQARFRAHIELPQGACRLFLDDRLAATAMILPQHFARGARVEVSTIDRQFLIAVQGKLLGRPLPIEAGAAKRLADAPPPPQPPFAIAARRLAVELAEIQVFRDVHYAAPAKAGTTWGHRAPCRLGANEYFVLGDNSPISHDSRVWTGQPGLPHELLAGKPFLAYRGWPPSAWLLGSRRP